MINYKVTDIEVYLSGKMNATEMHAFEEAMMNDPFLADAVDGYRSAQSTVHPGKDLSELKEKITKIQKGKVIRGSFRQWMSIAAGLVVMLSTAVVLYRIFNTEKASTSPKIVANLTKTDTSVTTKWQTIVDSNTVAVNEPAAELPKHITVIIPGRKEPAVKDIIQENKTSNNTGIASDLSVSKEDDAKISASPPVAAVTSKPSAQMNAETEAVTKKESSQQSNYVKLNRFSGQVIDENNQPLPFANIKEKTSGIGTYTDANGYFTIVSSDSVVNVETRSVGYFSTNAVMRNNQSQRIILKDQAVIANAPTRDQLYEKNKKRASAKEPEVEEIDNTQPADGWNNYNTYVLNNMRVPDIKEKQQQNQAEVEVSFDVNPDGSIANVKIERSTCKNCNQEAIRIIKDGPKWKSKTGKTERTRFTVQF